MRFFQNNNDLHNALAQLRKKVTELEDDIRKDSESYRNLYADLVRAQADNRSLEKTISIQSILIAVMEKRIGSLVNE